MTVQMKATEQYFPVRLFTRLYRVILASCGAVYDDDVQGQA